MTPLLPATTPPPATASPVLVAELESLAQELAVRLAPFRQSRLRGHYDLGCLLRDGDARPVVLQQVQALRTFCDALVPVYLHCHREVEDWRTGWPAASPEWKNWVHAVHRPALASALLNGVRLLHTEAMGDLEQIDQYLQNAA